MSIDYAHLLGRGDPQVKYLEQAMAPPVTKEGQRQRAALHQLLTERAKERERQRRNPDDRREGGRSVHPDAGGWLSRIDQLTSARRIEKFIRQLPFDIDEGCWPWPGHIRQNGYGIALVEVDGCMAQKTPHRVSYILFVADIQHGHVVDHLCGNKSCVNPAHLEAVTSAENSRRVGFIHEPIPSQVDLSRARLRVEQLKAGPQTAVNPDSPQHGARWLRTSSQLTDPRQRQRFLSKIPADAGADDCWPWPGFLNPDGYGLVQVKVDGRTVTRAAHRVAYIYLVGDIPDRHTIDHLCKNRSCINPAHLEAVTPAENTRRAHLGNLLDVCSRGHELVGANLDQNRRCLSCRHENTQRIVEARRWLGLTNNEYRAIYGNGPEAAAWIITAAKNTPGLRQQSETAIRCRKALADQPPVTGRKSNTQTIRDAHLNLGISQREYRAVYGTKRATAEWLLRAAANTHTNDGAPAVGVVVPNDRGNTSTLTKGDDSMMAQHDDPGTTEGLLTFTTAQDVATFMLAAMTDTHDHRLAVMPNGRTVQVADMTEAELLQLLEFKRARVAEMDPLEAQMFMAVDMAEMVTHAAAYADDDGAS